MLALLQSIVAVIPMWALIAGLVFVLGFVAWMTNAALAKMDENKRIAKYQKRMLGEAAARERNTYRYGGSNYNRNSHK
jgi:hypothetical protein